MRIVYIAPVVALTLLAACATPFESRVSRFNALAQAPQGSFVIQPRDARNNGSLEFRQYASLVTARLAQSGYQPASSPASATLVVTLNYGVDHGREKIESTPGFGGYGGFGYGGLGYGGFGRRGFGGFGGFGYGGFGGYGGGFGYDGFGGFGYPEINSYTQYTSFLDMEIRRTSSNDVVFEGHAIADSASDDLTRLVPNLVQAMFTDFPGRSGQTVRVAIDKRGVATLSHRG